MKAAWTVLKKELLDLFRDRRTVMISLLMGPLLGPALMVGLITLIASQEVERAEKALKLPVIGAEHAPNLVDWLGTMNVEIEPAPVDPDAAIRSQDEDVILRIPAEYAEAWRQSRPAPIEILYDSTRQDARTPVRRVEALLETYDRQMGALRLVARGINPAVGTPVLVQHRDLSTPESRAGMLLAFLPYILILGGFLGGAQLAMDATAGERERQSLEPLLATPAARGAIMSGKLGAAAVFALLSALLTLLAFKACFSFIPASVLGFKIDISWLAIAKLFVLILPIAVFGSCLVTLLAATTKSMKEAQSYMALLMLLPMLPTLVLMVSPVKNQLWMSAVPLLAQNQLILKVVRGEVVSGAEWAITLGAGVLLAGLVWLIAARLYHREQLAISA
ncbi:MAG: ABC transporter permease [Xanthomonadales bacterium]|nr:ABC transporter permease [Xanthomonadales bacterium]